MDRNILGVTNLSADSVRRRPQCIIFLCDLAVVNDPLQLLHHTLVYVRLDQDTQSYTLYKFRAVPYMYVAFNTASSRCIILMSQYDVSVMYFAAVTKKMSFTPHLQTILQPWTVKAKTLLHYLSL